MLGFGGVVMNAGPRRFGLVSELELVLLEENRVKQHEREKLLEVVVLKERERELGDIEAHILVGYQALSPGPGSSERFLWTHRAFALGRLWVSAQSFC
jgi:hypothetical protein